MHHAAAASILRSTGWLSQLPAALQDAVLAAGILKLHHAGEVIFRIGDPPGDLCGLVTGELSVFIAPHPIQPALVHVAQPGWWAGELALITNTARRISLVARRDSWIMHLSPEWVRTMAREDHETWRYIAQIMAINLDHALSQAVSWSINDAPARVALALRRLTDLEHTAGGPATVSVSHEELGSMSRLTRNAVAPILARFEAQGLIRRKYRRLEIPDVAAIARFAQERIAALTLSKTVDDA